MNETQRQTAMEILNLTPEEAEKNTKPIPEENACYCWNSTRGGLQMLIHENGEKLVLGAAFSFEKLLAMYREGKRN